MSPVEQSVRAAVRFARPTPSAYSHVKAGPRKTFPNIHFRSGWEYNYALYLDWLKRRGEIEGWEYEPKVFWFDQIKRGVRSYKPDFRIREKGREYYVEVKGHMDARSATKIKRMKKYHPTVELRVVDQRQYRAIADSVGRMIRGWE